ncbi:MAG: hypothetical protein ACR2FU_14550 [Streptosporangiaceae bacterium]
MADRPHLNHSTNGQDGRSAAVLAAGSTGHPRTARIPGVADRHPPTTGD